MLSTMERLERLNASAFVSYPTPKVVRINNWKLALLRYFVLLGVFLFIFVNQILLHGNHLRTASLSGNAQVSFQLPTIGNCDSFLNTCEVDFTPLDGLSYCQQGDDRRAESQNKTKKCVYRDPTELGGATPIGQVLIPTNIKTFVQRRKCFPEESTSWKCPDGIYEYLNEDGQPQADGQAQPWSDLFVADVERFRLLLDHSALSDGGVNAESFQMSGSWMNCSNDQPGHICSKKPILCFTSGCDSDSKRRLASLDLLKDAAPVASQEGITKVLNKTTEVNANESLKTNSRRRRRSAGQGSLVALAPDVYETFDDVESRYIERAMENSLAVSLQKGDIFPVSLLLDMAGVKLDDTPALRNTSTYRAQGLSLTIRIHYTNIRPWIGMHVLPWMVQERQGLEYTVQAISQPSEAGSRHIVSEEAKNVTSGRLMGRRFVQEDHGISIVVQQYGDMKVWDFSHMLVILTTTLGMLAVSNFILDTVALTFMERSGKYQQLKYESPADLEDAS